ncbi:MAG: hypothetical protein AAGF11_31495 [Myxococcota bacterium]
MSTPVPWTHRLAVASFCLLLLVPVVLRATVHPAPLPGLPSWLSKLSNIACLFTYKPEGWDSYYVQVRYPGHERWQTLDQAELFPLQPFGRRTRMHRLLSVWRAQAGARTQDMARWILRRHAQLHPEAPPPEAIRLGRTWSFPDPERPPSAGWRHPAWAEVPPERRRVIASYRRSELLVEPAAQEPGR